MVRKPGQTATVPLVEEQVDVAKREIVTGRVHIKTETDFVNERISQPLVREHCEIERVPVGRYVEAGAAPPEVRTHDNVTIVPVVEEVLVVEKRLLIKEELRITLRREREVAETPVTLQKQRVVIERVEYDEESPTSATKVKE